MKQIRCLICIFALAIAAGCSKDSAMAENPVEYITSVEAGVAQYELGAAATTVAETDPSTSGIAVRADQGHLMSVRVGAGAARSYNYDAVNAKWVPVSTPAGFFGGVSSDLTISLSKGLALGSQDGTAAGLLNVDSLCHTATGMVPSASLSGIEMKHARTLVKVLLDRVTMPDGTTGTINNYTPYRPDVLAGQDHILMAIVEPGAANLVIAVDAGANNPAGYITVPKANSPNGDFLAGYCYTIKLKVTVSGLVIETFGVAEWEKGPDAEAILPAGIAKLVLSGAGKASVASIAFSTYPTAMSIAAIKDPNGNYYMVPTAAVKNEVIDKIVINGTTEIGVGRKFDGEIALQLTAAFVPEKRLANDGSTLINTKGELALFGAGKCLQECDLHLNSAEKWTPLISADNTAVYDGCGFVIDGMKVETAGNAGLFASHTGRITNVHIGPDCEVEGSDGASSTGAVCGSFSGTSISACSNAGMVSGGVNVGGICGELVSGKIIACKNTGSITGSSSFCGGICGRCLQEIIACYNSAEIGAGYGITGPAGSVEACYTTGQQTSGYPIGGSVRTGCYCVDASPMSDSNLSIFASDAWPLATVTGWSIGNDPLAAKYWKSLGGWGVGSGGDNVYPSLWWEK